jgi:polyisoprenoid-binding protein YceI
MSAGGIHARAIKFAFSVRICRNHKIGGYMRGRLILLVLLVLSGAALNAQTPAKPARFFALDAPGSKIEFFVGSPPGNIKGVFNTWTGWLSQATPGVPGSIALSLQVNAASMSTGSGMKDKMIKGKDFFSVKDFPKVSFTSSGVIPSTDPNQFQIRGNFTLRGVTKPVVFQVALDPDNPGRGKVHADLSFHREEFGMTKSGPLMRGGDSVRVVVDLNVAQAPVPAVTEHYSWAKLVRITVNN